MKLVLRVLGTWFLGLALVLLIMDGTRSLSANEVVVTPLEVLWPSMHAQSWAALQGWIADSMASWALQGAAAVLFSWPAWAPVAVLGVIFLLIGRKRQRASYTDRI